jgi:hypothetical protein
MTAVQSVLADVRASAAAAVRRSAGFVMDLDQMGHLTRTDETGLKESFSQGSALLAAHQARPAG